jgi:hypothetical protein
MSKKERDLPLIHADKNLILPPSHEGFWKPFQGSWVQGFNP